MSLIAILGTQDKEYGKREKRGAKAKMGKAKDKFWLPYLCLPICESDIWNSHFYEYCWAMQTYNDNQQHHTPLAHTLHYEGSGQGCLMAGDLSLTYGHCLQIKSHLAILLPGLAKHIAKGLSQSILITNVHWMTHHFSSLGLCDHLHIWTIVLLQNYYLKRASSFLTLTLCLVLPSSSQK